MEVAEQKPRVAGFGKQKQSANQAYKAYVGDMPDGQTPQSFKDWLKVQQANGHFLQADTVSKNNWRQVAGDPNATTADEQVKTSDAPAPSPAALAEKTAEPFKILGMQPVVGVLVIGTVIYIGYRILK